MKEFKKKDMYQAPMGMTQQFRFCGNPFRIDMYKGCSFGCRYCFSNSRKGGIEFKFKIADINKVRKMFEKALDTDREFKDVNVELLRHRVPLHCGGLSDPFQELEKEYKLTYELIKLTKKYNYPMMLSTKTAHLDDEYFEVLDPQIHAFQISIMGYDNEWLRRYETNTPTIEERYEFIKKLKEKGFWVSVRIQPLISLEQAEKVVEKFSPIVDYITVEHLKIPTDNTEIRALFEDDLDKCTKPLMSRSFEVKPEIKLANILRLKEISKCPIGCGDNDLHEYSDSNCCCGIDTINENFDGWLKYNYTCWLKGCLDENTFIPQCSVRGCFQSTSVFLGLSYKECVDKYIERAEAEKAKK